VEPTVRRGLGRQEGLGGGKGSMGENRHSYWGVGYWESASAGGHVSVFAGVVEWVKD